ncbi:uncharacterized protein LOC112575922 [Pomacea canaliculata]|uniref:uncharacterized protein LOC112575922 n=1 Tax=Pomacea canaliculata TaxID=400727 RepID=UPI000D731BD6|nr:uncharacterized protein LOC112575922 [Pomacea canaliculata]
MFVYNSFKFYWSVRSKQNIEMMTRLDFLQHSCLGFSPAWSFTQKFFMLLACVPAVIFSAADVGSKNRCTVSPVLPLSDAVLTCYFPEDISVTKKDFTVYHYARPGSPVAVIDCWWIKGKLDCYSQLGVEYNKTVGKDLTATIKQVTSAHTGKYACQVSGYEASSLEICELHLKLGTENTCRITYDKSESQARLDCFFNENLAETRKSFAVYRSYGQDKQAVLVECLWENNQPKCQVASGYQLQDAVSSYLTLWIQEVTKEKEGNYYCLPAGSLITQQSTCFLSMSEEDEVDDNLVIGLLLGFLLLAVTVAVGIFLLRFIKTANHLTETDGESQRILNVKENTNMFEEHLKSTVQRMYPNMPESFYFVPPLYFNKCRYKPQCVADQVIYVPHSADLSDVRHDQAMHHVLQCLHHMAKQEQEHMFVLTQFQYEDYLNNPGVDFERHCLPLPSGLVDEDKSVACFDFLVVHQAHGILVGVVKAVSDEDQDVQQATDVVVSKQRDGDDFIESQVVEAVQQLKKAVRMINHLMSDHKPFPGIRQTLMLPRLTRQALLRAVVGNTELVENLRNCLGATAAKDPTDFCLCAEDLSDTTGYNMINCIQESWKWLVDRKEEGNMTQTLYLSMIARFFGPATQSTLMVPDDCEHFVLPKTLAEAVSLTGDLYERLMLNQDMVDLLEEPILFLGGPPNSGKTRMMTLVGNKWLSEGHDVFIVNDSSSKSYPLLSHQLKTLTARHESDLSDNSTRGRIYENECNFTSDVSLKTSIDKMITKAEGKDLYVLVDGAHLHGEKVEKMLEIISSRASSVSMWVSCSPEGMSSVSVPHKLLDNHLHCPPAIIKRMAEESHGCAKTQNTSHCPAPTDGPAVLNIFHKYSLLNPWGHDCVDCGLEVGSFLTKHLLVSESNYATTKLQKNNSENDKDVTDSAMWETKGLYLHFNDILIIFEDSGNSKDYGFLTGLRKSGVRVQTVTDESHFDVEHSDCAWAMDIDHLLKYKINRKILVYVEKSSECQNVENKVLAFSHCTSQLVVVKSSL